MRVKTFNKADYYLQKENGYWVVRNKPQYAIVGAGDTWQEAVHNAGLDKHAAILNRETHRCEARGCTKLSTTKWCPFHHFTREDGSDRPIGILGLPLEVESTNEME